MDLGVGLAFLEIVSSASSLGIEHWWAGRRECRERGVSTVGVASCMAPSPVSVPNGRRVGVDCVMAGQKGGRGASGLGVEPLLAPPPVSVPGAVGLGIESDLAGQGGGRGR